MSDFSHTSPPPDTLAKALDAVRARIRAYALVEGIAAVAVVLGIAFWMGLAWDWKFEPSPDARQMALWALAAVACFVAYRFLLRRVFARIPDESIALLLERRFPQLHDHVATAVHLQHIPQETRRGDPELVSLTQRAAADSLEQSTRSGLFNLRPLAKTLGLAVVFVGSIVAFFFLNEEAFGIWMRRIALGQEPWPRRTQLEVVGFPADEQGRRAAKVARQDDFEFTVRADLTGGHEDPRAVEIRYHTSDGRQGRDTLVRVGEAVPGRDTFQTYRYRFQDVAETLSFQILGGDDRVDDLELIVVDRPQIVSINVLCRYPGYLGRPEQQIPVRGTARIAEGTDVTIELATNKPLVEATVRSPAGEYEEQFDFAASPQEAFQIPYGALTADETLLITVRDIDGITSREPYRVSLAVEPDEPPRVAVYLEGIGSAVTSEAVIPFAGEITDDHGVDRAWYEFGAGDETPAQRPLTVSPRGGRVIERIAAFDLRTRDRSSGERILTLTPGERLVLTICADDLYDVTDDPHTGRSQPFVFDIVTPAELLALLETREFSLRQQFEAICDKVSDTRNLLARVDFSEESAEDENDSALRSVLERRTLRMAAGKQNVQQATQETLGVSAGFENLYLQLENNRIENSELKQRLHAEIAVPLRQLAEEGMPELESRLQWLQDHSSDRVAAREAHQECLAEADEVIVAMRAILERMRALESYNEVLALLREIIADQTELTEQTRERQQQLLRSLFGN